MPKFDKLRETIFMMRHRSNFKKVSIEVLRENQKFIEHLQTRNVDLKNKHKKLEKCYNEVLEAMAKMTYEKKILEKRIEELEKDQARWNMLDL